MSGCVTGQSDHHIQDFQRREFMRSQPSEKARRDLQELLQRLITYRKAEQMRHIAGSDDFEGARRDGRGALFAPGKALSVYGETALTGGKMLFPERDK